MAQTRDDRYHGGLRCEERVESGYMAFPCTLPRDHDGPHYVVESARSRAERENWEAEQEAKNVPEPTHENCVIGHAHEGPCEPEVQPEAQQQDVRVRPLDDGDYLVTLPSGQQVRVDGEGRAERPSGVIGVQGSLKQLLDPGGFTKFDLPAPTKQRAGDQRLPDVDERRGDVQSLVIRDIEQRRKVGISRYGTALQTFNGRNTIQDLYEELIDAAIYARSVLEMRAAYRAELHDVIESAIREFGLTDEETDPPLLAETIVDKVIDSLAMKRAGAGTD